MKKLTLPKKKEYYHFLGQYYDYVREKIPVNRPTKEVN